MNISFTLLLLCSVITFAVGRRYCYECTSSTSWSDCNERASKGYCPVTSNDCAKLRITTTSRSTGQKRTQYMKACTQTCVKSDLAICQNTLNEIKSCDEYHCCGSDYCNKSSRLTASLTLTMLASAATAMAFVTNKITM